MIDEELPDGGVKLPPDYALQHPQDWLDRLRRRVQRGRGGQRCADGHRRYRCRLHQPHDDAVIRGWHAGLPVLSLLNVPAGVSGSCGSIARRKAETDRINAARANGSEPWLSRYGGTIGLEWFFPKVLETLNHEPGVYDAADVWLEAGDWFVRQLVDGPFPKCSAKESVAIDLPGWLQGTMEQRNGFPSPDYFAAVNPKMRSVVSEKMPGTLVACAPKPAN